jgi:hypothetical protein
VRFVLFDAEVSRTADLRGGLVQQAQDDEVLRFPAREGQPPGNAGVCDGGFSGAACRAAYKASSLPSASKLRRINCLSL